MKVSIVTPSFNQGRFIAQAIESVLTQKWDDFEHIIVDNCSTDETVSVLERYPHLKIIREPDKGQSDALNKGFKMATGDIVGWLNADDIYLPNCFHSVIDVFKKHQESDIVYGDYRWVDKQGHLISLRCEIDFDLFILKYLHVPYIPSIATFFKQNIFKDKNFLDIDYHLAMDHELFLRLALKGYRFTHIRSFLTDFRWHSKNKSTLYRKLQIIEKEKALFVHDQYMHKMHGSIRPLIRFLFMLIARTKRTLLKIAGYNKQYKYFPMECPFCGKSVVNKYRNSGSIYQCKSCSLSFRGGFQPYQKFEELYKKAWTDIDNNKDETGGTDIRLARVYAQKMVELLGLKDLSGLKILDFGAGKGCMLTALSELGADAYGVEPFGYEHLKNKGLKVFRSLEEIPGNFSFDGVVTIDVIEHIFSPWDTIEKLYGFLADNGWLCVTTPNADSFNARFLRSNWRELHNPSHLYFLTPRCLEAIFTRSGYTKFRRLSWFVQYSNNSMRRLVHYLLQLLKLDGEIRYIVYKN